MHIENYKMDTIAIINICVFILGILVSIISVFTIITHIKWIKKSSASLILIFCLLDDLVDNICTLIFSSDTMIHVIKGVGGDSVNSINPILAITLRIIIFSFSFTLLYITHKHVKKYNKNKEKVVNDIKKVIHNDVENF